MKIGIQLPEVEREVRWPEYLAMARAAEEVGFESIWLGDHLLYDGPERAPWEAWTLLSALAAATTKVRLGPLVACAGFHPPAVLAKMASTIDEISQGRFVLGIGSGWNRREFDAFGIPYDRRVSRFEEAFAIISGLLRGERVTLHGTYHSADDAVLLPKPARQTPIMLGSNGRRMLGIALPHVQAWNTWWDDYGNAPEGLAKLIEDTGVGEAAHVSRSACMLVQLDGLPVERRPEGMDAVEQSRFAAHIAELGEAGADEVIVVASPISERSIRTLGELLPR
jgi:alkanesulfonate monooxygenase SsuD/methylene tetrahydromethanopterin reductase-like flavin-dependent oxidoreductase (luciferase family)